MKRYQMTLKATYTGDVVVDAQTKKEAEKKGDEILSKSGPYWFESSVDSVSEIRVFDEKKHEHEYEWGNGKCICGKVNRSYKI